MCLFCFLKIEKSLEIIYTHVARLHRLGNVLAADKIRARLKKGGEKIAKAISDDIITDETMAYYATLVIINSSDGKKHLYDAVLVFLNLKGGGEAFGSPKGVFFFFAYFGCSFGQ